MNSIHSTDIDDNVNVKIVDNNNAKIIEETYASSSSITVVAANVPKPLAPIELGDKLIDIAKSGNMNELQTLSDTYDLSTIINTAKDKDGKTALMWASCNGHEAVVRLLIEKGADVNAKNNNGWTALMRASDNGNEAVVRLLKSNGAK